MVGCDQFCPWSVISHCGQSSVTVVSFVSDIAIFVLKRDVKLQLTNCGQSSITVVSAQSLCQLW